MITEIFFADCSLGGQSDWETDSLFTLSERPSELTKIKKSRGQRATWNDHSTWKLRDGVLSWEFHLFSVHDLVPVQYTKYTCTVAGYCTGYLTHFFWYRTGYWYSCTCTRYVYMTVVQWYVPECQICQIITRLRSSRIRIPERRSIVPGMDFARLYMRFTDFAHLCMPRFPSFPVRLHKMQKKHALRKVVFSFFRADLSTNVF